MVQNVIYSNIIRCLILSEACIFGFSSALLILVENWSDWFTDRNRNWLAAFAKWPAIALDFGVFPFTQVPFMSAYDNLCSHHENWNFVGSSWQRIQKHCITSSSLFASVLLTKIMQMNACYVFVAFT